jgi:uncharacterized membrane protein YeaQ/YmgE (transglycosylase-associated protein family)
MSPLQKLLQKIGFGGSVLALLLIIIGFFIIGPLFLLWGLDLMGFEVQYGFKSFIGAGLVIFVMRPSSFTKTK